MLYYESRTLSGGTFTPGTDWWGQFIDVTPTGLLTLTGEVNSPAITDATAVSIALRVVNPWTMSLYIEADASHPIQVQYADQQVEYTAAAKVDIELPSGTYPVRFIRETGAIVVRAQFVGPGTALVSLYGKGSNPLMAGSGGVIGPGDSGAGGPL